MSVLPPSIQHSLSVLGLSAEQFPSRHSLSVAYRRKAMEVHPDRQGGRNGDFVNLQEHYQRLLFFSPEKTQINEKVPTDPNSLSYSSLLHKTDAQRENKMEEIANRHFNVQTFNGVFDKVKQDLQATTANDGYGEWLQSTDDHSEQVAKKRERVNPSLQQLMLVDDSLHPSGSVSFAYLDKDEIGNGREMCHSGSCGESLSFMDLKQAYSSSSSSEQDPSLFECNVKDSCLTKDQLDRLQQSRKAENEKMEMLTSDELEYIRKQEKELQLQDSLRALRVKEQEWNEAQAAARGRQFMYRIS